MNNLTKDMLQYLPGLVALICLLNAAGAWAIAPVPYHVEPYVADSSLQTNETESSATTYEEIIRAPAGTPWMRVHFESVSLAPGSYIKVTSLFDGAEQPLDANALKAWRNSSAYFNGDAVKVSYHAAPGESGGYFRIDSIEVGEHVTENQEAVNGEESQCGSFDNRVASTDPAVGRIMPIGCTGWIVSNGANLTAGHCVSDSRAMTTLQFNVPASLANGTTQNPPPEDQYPIEPKANMVWFDDGSGAIGNDWAVFETFDNTSTGLSAVEAQNAYYRMSRDLATAAEVTTVRITGYGADNVPLGSSGGRNADNQTLQTHSGAYLGETVQAASDVFIEYTVDTEGGNSGGPVIYEKSGWPNLTLGIHTNGGCNPPSSGNIGTGFEHNNLEIAIRNFHGTSNVEYVDNAHFDTLGEDGSVFRPHDTVLLGLAEAAARTGVPVLSIVEGTYTETGTGTITITEPMDIIAPVGTVSIR